MLSRMMKLRREDGASLVELALVVSILGSLLLVGTAEVGAFIFASIELADATHAAAAYAAEYYITNASLPTQTEVASAASNDSAELTKLLSSGSSLTATLATGCGTGDASAGNAVPTCVSGLPYVQVTCKAKIASIFNYLNIGPISMTSVAKVNLVN